MVWNASFHQQIDSNDKLLERKFIALSVHLEIPVEETRSRV